MTGFLASVRDLEEAELAIMHGADIIDLKAPSLGALGAVSLLTMREVVNAVNSRYPVSATIGDLPSVPARIQRGVDQVAATGVDFVKVGFFDNKNRETMIKAIAKEIRRGARVVAVLFADRESDLSATLDVFFSNGFSGVMVDTASKSGKSLRGYRADRELGLFITECKRIGLLAGLAGSLSVADIAPLIALHPDYLGFRGALCEGSRREGKLAPAAIRHIRMRIPDNRTKISASRIQQAMAPLTYLS